MRQRLNLSKVVKAGSEWVLESLVGSFFSLQMVLVNTGPSCEDDFCGRGYLLPSSRVRV